MKKIAYILITILLFLTCNSNVYADSACNKQTVEQMAKIVYHEVGYRDCTEDSSLNFYARITTAGVILNNANKKSGSTWYDKMMNLTDNNYGHYSTYKNNNFDSDVQANKNELIYIAGLVLTGKYALPKTITLQANKDIVTRNGSVFDIIPLNGSSEDLYFGYEGGNTSTQSALGATLQNTSSSYYRSLANSYKKSDYSNYTSSNVCSLLNGDESYTITYDLVGGEWASNASKPTSAKVDATITISNPQKTITVTGDANGTGATIGSPLVVTQEFAGWTSSSANGLGGSATFGSSSSNLASWTGTATLNTYFKNLRSSEGTIKMVATWKNITKELSTVTKSGYTCKWNTKKDGTGTSYASKERYTFVSGSSSGFTLYAQCVKSQEETEEKETNYIITYSSDGSTNIPDTQTKEAKESITITSQLPKKEGYTFIEWNTKDDGSGTSYNPGDNYTLDKSLTLYAIWEKNDSNSNGNPNTGVSAMIIFPLIALLAYVYIKYYIKRMQENNIV